MNETNHDQAPPGSVVSVAPRATDAPTSEASGPLERPIGLLAPEWALSRSARGTALWRHAGVLSRTAGHRVEVLALDRAGLGRRFSQRDEWNVPAPGARFRVRRVKAGGRTALFDDLARARLESALLDWVRQHDPRVVHVLDLDPFGAGVLLALDAAGVPSVLSVDRPDALLAPDADPEAFALQREALALTRRVIVRTPLAAAAVEVAGAPRASVRVINAERGDERSVLRAYASLYRLIAPLPTSAAA